MYDFGLGEIQVENLKIGDADAKTFAPEFNWHRDSLVKDTKFLSRQVGYDQFSYLLKAGKDVLIKTKPDSIAFDIDLNFNRGLAHVDNSGNPSGTSIDVFIQYRKVGTTQWITVLPSQIKGHQGTVSGGGSVTQFPVTTKAEARHEDGVIYYYVVDSSQVAGPSPTHHGVVQMPWGDADRYTGTDGREYLIAPANWIKGYPEWNGLEASDGWSGRTWVTAAVVGAAVTGPGDAINFQGATFKPFVSVVSIDGLAAAEYEIKVTRTTADNTDNRLYQDMALTLIKSFKEGTVVNLQKKHTMLEMKIIASEKIQGTVQNLSGICHSVLRTTTDGVNFKKEATRNPAWIVLDILTGEGNPKPLDDKLIDWPSFIKLANYCDTKKHYADFVVDYQTTIQTLLDSVLSVAHAGMRFTSAGLYGILIDEEQTVPRQLITPANSWGFSGGRTFADIPHGFLVTFINPALNWQKDERIVYTDGYDKTNATKFETLDTFAITDSDQAWRYGRYMLAQGIHRSETFTVSMDIENLVVQRGDLVHVAHDVPRIGGMACRVVSMNGNEVTIDQTLSIYPNSCSVRTRDGLIRTGKVVRAIGSTKYELDPLLIAGLDAGDIIVMGQTNRVIGQYIVQSINPGANMSAELTMVKYVPEVYRVDTEAIPPWDANLSNDLINNTDLVANNAVAEQVIIYKDRMPFSKIDLKWSISGSFYDHSEISISAAGVPKFLAGTSNNVTYEQLIDLLKQYNLVDTPVTFEIVPISAGGVQGVGTSVVISPQPDRIPPAEVDGFGVNILNNSLVEVFWHKNREPDIAYYEVRYSPQTTSPVWFESQKLTTVNHETTRTTAGARTGSYMISAVDTSGNRSNPRILRASVEDLPGLDLIEEINDAPKWAGHLIDMSIVNGTPMLDGGYTNVKPIGYYNVEKVFDAGEIQELRIMSMISGFGVTADDFISTWVPLSAAKPLARATADDFDIWLEVATSNTNSVMANWVPLSSAKPIGATQIGWMPWRRIESADVTGRFFKFRIVCASYNPKVNVKLMSGKILIDVMERTFAVQDVRITDAAAGVRVDFVPPFRSIPTLAVTIDGNAQQVLYEIVNKRNDEATIMLRDVVTGNPTTGKIDVAAIGWGRIRTQAI